MNLLNKISTKTVVGTINAAIIAKDEKKAAALYRVFGIASDVRHGESTYGEYTEFRGQFRAINMETGEESQSGKLFLPVVASNLLEGQLSNDDISSVQFAFDIGAVLDESSSVGFTYQVTPVLEMGEGDPLAGLAQNLPKLAAPPKSKSRAKS